MKIRYTILGLAAGAVLLAAGGGGVARAQAAPDTAEAGGAGVTATAEQRDTGAEIPDTPLGRWFAAWLEAFNARDIEGLRAVHAEMAGAQMAEVRTAFSLMLAKEMGTLRFERVLSEGEGGLTVLLYATLPESWITLTFGGPGGDRILPAEPPADAARPPVSSEDDLRRELERYLEKLCAADAFSGTVLVAKDDRTVFETSCGMADQEQGIANGRETRYNLGSMNKMFTAVAIAQLVEQGKLSFDDPIGKYLPDYSGEAAEKVTIGHLLTHTSGLGDYFGPEFFEGAKDRISSPREYFPLFQDKPLQFEPGTSWRYSNAGFVVLGAIIEAVTGESYYQYIRAHIYEPAGMTSSDSYRKDQETPNLATGYTTSLPPDPTQVRAGDGLAPRVPNTEQLGLMGSPAGGGYSTVGDLRRFAEALLSGRLLSKEMTELVMQGKVATRFGPPGGDASTVESREQYGYGFMDARVNGERIVGHGGDFAGVSANLDMYVESGYTVVVLSNYDRGARVVNGKIRELLTGGGA